MRTTNYALEKPLFCALLKALVGEPIDIAKFDSDQLYASGVFERASGSKHFELRNLAAYVQMRHQVPVEAITLTLPEQGRDEGHQSGRDRCRADARPCNADAIERNSTYAPLSQGSHFC